MGRSIACVVGVSIALSGWVARAGAQADDVTDEAREAASAHFAAGVEAAREQDWQRARREFAQAYERVPQPEILVNLARAQVETGRLLAASRSYERFLEQTSGTGAEGEADAPVRELRAKAEAALERVRERIPRLRVEGADVGDVVRVDAEGYPVEADEPIEVEVDPGAHAVALRRDGRTLARSEVRVEEGETRSVVLVAPVTPDGEASLTDPGPSEAGTGEGAFVDDDASGSSRSSVLSSPWLWVGVGVVVLGAAGLAVGLAVGGGGSGKVRGNTDPPILRVR